MQANLPELSKQGNAEAIAASLNQALKVRGVQAQVVLRDNCAKVMLESTLVPNQKLLAPFVFKSISDLQLDAIDTLYVYGRQKGQNAPAWTETFTIEKVQSPEAVDEATVPVDDTALAEQNQYKELAQQGNLEAIATLLNQQLGDENVTIEVSSEASQLKVVAKTDQFLEGPVFAKRVYEAVVNLNLKPFDSVEIYKQKVSSPFSFQLKAFSLAKEA